MNIRAKIENQIQKTYAYLSKDDPKNALTSALNTWNLAKHKLSSFDPLYQKTLVILADSYHASENSVCSARIYRSVITLLIDQKQFDSPLLQIVAANFANIHSQNNDNHEIIQTFEYLLTSLTKTCEISEVAIYLYEHLMVASIKLKKFHKAFHYSQKYLAEFSHSRDPHLFDLANLNFIAGHLARSIGLTKEATKHLKISRDLYTGLFGGESEEARACWNYQIDRQHGPQGQGHNHRKNSANGYNRL